MKKRLTACITALLLCIGCLTMTSCKEDDGKGYVFGYDISSNPGSKKTQSIACFIYKYSVMLGLM